MTATAGSSQKSLRSRLDLWRFEIGAARVYEVVALLALTTVAVALRSYKLGEWSLWIDEVISMTRAQEIGTSSSVLEFSHPLYYVLIKPVIEQFGASEWAGRSVAAAIGAISIPILYFPVRKLLGTQIALLAVGFLAVSTWHIYWSQTARFYAQLHLFFNLAFLTFLIGTETGKSRYFAASSLFFLLAVASHATALLLAPILVAYAFAIKILRFERPTRLSARDLAFYIGIPLALWALSELYRIRTFNTGATPNLPTVFFGNPNNSPMWLVGTLVYYVGVSIVSLGVGGAVYLVMRKDRLGLALALGATFPVFATVLLSPVSYTASRYFFVALFSWAVLAAFAVREIITATTVRAWPIAAVVILLFFADPIANDLLYFQYQKGNRLDWKGAFAYVGDHETPGDRVVSTTAPMGEYYLGEPVVELSQLSPESIEAWDQKTWLVIDMTPISMEWGSWLEEETQFMETFDVNAAARNFKMRVYLYDPAR